ncbi:MAG: endonuclease III [Fusobacteria bacterium]|nr:endonuclease III [Fusobacteriota bacterium]
MGISKRKKHIIEGLLKEYPEAKAELDFSNPFELLVATILSAQTTDVQVNKVTEKLFKIAGTPEKLGAMSENELIEYIKSIGLYKNKSKNLISMSKQLLEKHDGIVPATREELEKLPGVGRKTANVVLSNAFDIPALAVDTHVFRVANRLGLVAGKDVLATEIELLKVVPKEHWSKMHHCLIFHGRRVCSARSPKCDSCTLSTLCSYRLKL